VPARAWGSSPPSDNEHMFDSAPEVSMTLGCSRVKSARSGVVRDCIREWCRESREYAHRIALKSVPLPGVGEPSSAGEAGLADRGEEGAVGEVDPAVFDGEAVV
jgi:hypothetical protein